jgi:hypothetical protein
VGRFNRASAAKWHWRLIKLPAIWLLMLSGWIMEFMVELPFAVLTALDRGGGGNERPRCGCECPPPR